MRHSHLSVRTRLARAATVLVVALAALSASGGGAAAAPPPDPPVSRALATSGKASVNAAYWRTWVPSARVRPGWTGSAAGCRRGADSVRHRRASQRALNFVRDLAGLDPVTVTDALSRRALAAALIMDANDALSHYPPRSWRCWTKTGATAAGRSNLLWASSVTVGSALQGYLSDWGASNTAVGHRRWLMYPFTTTMGSGSTSQANAFWVLGASDPSRANPAYVGWPTEGWFPRTLEPQGRWSLSSGQDSTRFGSAKVRVVRVASGAVLKVTRHQVVDGYGMPTLVWEMPRRFARTGAYRVTVSGIGEQGTSATTSTSYVVRLFAPVRPGRAR